MVDRYALVTRNAEEVVTQDELRSLLDSRPGGKAYIGFEPSGLMHLGSLICMMKVKDLLEAGFEVTVFLADWHAYINDKLNGDIDAIRACGRYIEDCFKACGIGDAKYVYASEFVGNPEYWAKVLRVAKNSSLSRVKHALTIMGRKEDEAELDSSKLIYPSMQVADIFELDVDIAYGGMDQRKAHMLARDIAEKLDWRKPIALHTPLLTGLKGGGRMDDAVWKGSGTEVRDGMSGSGERGAGESKMSKSMAESCIFIHDLPESIDFKLKKAYCAPGEVSDNPVLDIARFIVIPLLGGIDIVKGGKGEDLLTISDANALCELYSRKEIHPADLKKAVCGEVTKILKPIHDYFVIAHENYDVVKTLIGR